MEKECKEKDIRINKKGNWVDLTELPRKNGKCNKIDWANSVGYFVKFKYEDIEGEIEIVDYKIVGGNYKIFIKYDNITNMIGLHNFCKCGIKKLITEYRNKKINIKENHVDVSKLPVHAWGINWSKSIGEVLNFKYNNTIGDIKILKYYKEEQRLLIEYNKREFNILTGSILKCNLGRIIGDITTEFKIQIGEIFKDDKRDIIIIDRKIKTIDYGYQKYNKKMYKYHCNICGYNSEGYYKDGEYHNEYWTEEGNLLKGSGCACCSNSIITVEGINDIPTTAPWMVKYFQGGYDEAKKYSKSSNQKIYPICPDCNTIKKSKMIIGNIYKRHSIGCNKCGDGFSYPEKFIYSVLQQLNIDFITQYSPKWVNNKRYDFYIPKYNMIIETHGMQHYDNVGFVKCGGRNLKEEQNNDIYKEKLARKNGVKYYIQLDCRESNIEYIKNSLLDSELNNMFDLYNVDWKECEEFAVGNLCREICEYRANHEDMSTNDIGKVFNIDMQTIRKYLKIGNDLKWCNYNVDEEMVKNAHRNGKINKKSVEIFKNGISLGVFESCHDLERQSEGLFNTKLGIANISMVANNKRHQHKGFTFKYVNEDSLEEIS